MRPTFALLALCLAVTAGLGTEGALRWIDRPFAGFLPMDNGVIASAGLPAWPATRDGSIYQAEIVAFAGQRHAETGSEGLRAHVDSVPVGTPIAYTLRHGGRLQERTIATRHFGWSDFVRLHGAYLLNGLFLAGAGLALLWGIRSHPGAAAAAPLLLLAALWAFTAMDLYGPHRLFRVHALAESLLFAAALHMALGFPQPLPLVRREPWLLGLPYALAGVLAVAYQASLYAPTAYVTVHLTAVGFLGAALLFLIACQVGRVFGANALARRQIKLVAVGSLVALVPAVWLSIAEPFTGGSSSQNAMAFTAFLFPLSIAWAVLRPPGPISRRSGGWGPASR